MTPILSVFGFWLNCHTANPSENTCEVTFFLSFHFLTVCCFVLLNLYWGITVLGFPHQRDKGARTGTPAPIENRRRTSSTCLPQTTGVTLTKSLPIITSMATLTSGPLIFLFKQTHNYPVDKSGLLLVCVLLGFIELILGNRYGPRVSSRASLKGRTGTHDPSPKSTTSLLTLSPFR